MTVRNIALAPDDNEVDVADLSRVSAAIQRQIARDLAPIWGASATIDAFARLEDIPLGYSRVVITRRPLGAQSGVHIDDGGQPYALVEYGEQWSITASHECLELVVDPSCSRLIAGPSPRPDQGRVEFLLEICDPSEAAHYTVNDVAVSDFYTPSYFDPVPTPGTRYSFTGTISEPRQVLEGGYLSWLEPVSGNWWQRRCIGGLVHDVCLGKIALKTGCMREAIDGLAADRVARQRGLTAIQVQQLNTKQELAQRASSSSANRLRERIGKLIVPAVPSSPLTGALAPPIVAVSSPLVAEVSNVISQIQLRPNLPRAAELLAVLRRAQAQLSRDEADPLAQNDPKHGGDEMALALVRSARAEPGFSASALTGAEILGFGDYQDIDVGWIGSFLHRVFGTKVPFRTPSENDGPLVSGIQDDVVIAMAGDWGTGNQSSKDIAEQMKAIGAHHTIHLGDVYYSGTDSEEMKNFVNLWPPGSLGSWALNSNHEMYSGGHGYYNVALGNSKFAKQRGFSFFALEHSRAMVIGLDTAYHADGFLYSKGNLQNPQLAWLTRIGEAARAADKRIILLSHHDALTYRRETIDPLWSQVSGALGRPPEFWYWGHVHGVAVYEPFVSGGVKVRARCVGHGGVPYAPEISNPALQWTESDLAGDAEIPKRALNGFVVLRFTKQGLTEEFIDEKGRTRLSQSIAW